MESNTATQQAKKKNSCTQSMCAHLSSWLHPPPTCGPPGCQCRHGHSNQCHYVTDNMDWRADPCRASKQGDVSVSHQPSADNTLEQRDEPAGIGIDPIERRGNGSLQRCRVPIVTRRRQEGHRARRGGGGGRTAPRARRAGTPGRRPAAATASPSRSSAAG
jgi:hypothetical protein